MTEDSVVSKHALLVSVNLGKANFDEEQDEFLELVVSADLKPVETITCCRTKPDPRFFVGSGKANEIKRCVMQYQIGVVIFNHILSVQQERNLSQLCQCNVIDRVALILDIFAQRARSAEGKLQVELAQLKYLSSRLVRGWTHLERQKGGIGLRGPGETQLETDRRLIGRRIKTLSARLQNLRCQRQQGRKRRRRSAIPIISLVGYTNAGKSTLFNYLTGAGVYVVDKLFATLDNTFRRVEITTAVSVILVDTIGFIRDIPHDLVDAFHATLEESRESDLILHVIDVTDQRCDSRIQQVNQVIREIGAEHVPQIEVYNKIDQGPDIPVRVPMSGNHKLGRIWLSARTGEGVDGLLAAIGAYIRSQVQYYRLSLPVGAAKIRARLFSLGVVHDEQMNEQGGWIMGINMAPARLRQLFKGIDAPGVEEILLQCDNGKTELLKMT